MEITLLPTGAAGLVALVVILVLRGALVPRRTLRDLLAGRDARIAELGEERDTWRAAYETSEAGRHLAQEQARELLVIGQASAHALEELSRTAREVGHARAAVAAEGLASNRP